ncbi:hypothetical protein SM007_39825 [Streptomyces avermitilis]|nr:hypothetical protein SM007_39825 [Streptomyces avermitilis]
MRRGDGSRGWWRRRYGSGAGRHLEPVPRRTSPRVPSFPPCPPPPPRPPLPPCPPPWTLAYGFARYGHGR